MEGWKNGRMVGRKDGNIGHDGMALLGFRTLELRAIDLLIDVVFFRVGPRVSHVDLKYRTLYAGSNAGGNRNKFVPVVRLGWLAPDRQILEDCLTFLY